MNVSTRHLAILIAFLVTFLIGFSIFAKFEPKLFSKTRVVNITNTNSSLPPPLTPVVQAQLATSRGFQYLVSYTDLGFEPATLTINRGETVRFTNNSTEDFWIASMGTSDSMVYPSDIGNECGQSAFDSCRIIGRGEFWEFTFDRVGMWSYQNNRDTKMTGTVIAR